MFFCSSGEKISLLGQKTERFSLKNRYFKREKESTITVNQGTY